MGLFTDIQFELISQTSIVQYIEYQFEQELEKAKSFLNIKIEEKLYDNNSDYMRMLDSACDDLLEKNAQSYLIEKTLPDIARNVDFREPIGEVIQYCVEILETGSDLEINELKKELDEINKMDDDDNCYKFTEKQIEQIIEAAHIINDRRINLEMEEQDEIMNLLKISIKLVDNFSSSNIFRQSFINIFSVFDAYVFEHLKQFFYTHPKELEKFLDIKNSEKVKITLDEMLDFNSIEELRKDMVQKQFSGRYLSELVSKLKKYKPEIFNGIEYLMLMEMIERRNVHLHNKGFVDNKYYNSFNIYKLSIGDYAYIDSNYLFIKVFNTLSQFSINIEKELCI